MATFAQIDGLTVKNVLIADSLAIAEEVTGSTCVEYFEGTMVSPGYTYDSETGVFTAPVIIEHVTEEPTE
jgi:glutamine amidotransferase-like uncharacterized protein